MSTRTQRVAQLIQQEISTLFARGMKDPRIGMVTVTGAKVSPDLREAWIYYSVLGDEQAKKDTSRGLAAAKGFIKRDLGQKVALRVMPELHFVFDESIERGARIERLLREVKDQDRGRTLADAEADAAKAAAAGVDTAPAGDEEKPDEAKDT